MLADVLPWFHAGGLPRLKQVAARLTASIAEGTTVVSPVTLAAIAGSLAAIKALLRCTEILVRARADEMRESARRVTILSVLTVMQEVRRPRSRPADDEPPTRLRRGRDGGLVADGERDG
jgi:hypothetical protein